MRAALLLCAIATTACATATATRFDPAKVYPLTPDSVDVRVYSDQRPACAFEEIGTISSDGGDLLTTDEMLVAIKRKARELGGHAVVGFKQSTRSAGGRSTGTMKVLTGTVIRYREGDSCTT